MYDFDTKKYVALAYGSPAGVELARLVEAKWPDWVRLVEEARWRVNWPKNKPSEEVAKTVYASAVWGFGISGWLREGHPTEKRDMMRPLANARYEDQDIANSPAASMIHPEMRELGMPVEFGDLDIWLETLWVPAAT